MTVHYIDSELVKKLLLEVHNADINMIRYSPLLLLVAIISIATPTSASIFLSTRSLTNLGLQKSSTQSSSSSTDDAIFHRRRQLSRALQQQKSRGINTDGKLSHPLAMAIPGNGVAEQVVSIAFFF